MRTSPLNNIFSALVLVTTVLLMAMPSFALQESKPKEKPQQSEQENEDSKSEDGDKKDKGDQEDENAKKKDSVKKQIRTGTQRIGRMMNISRASDDMIAVVNPLTTSAAEATVAVMSGKKQVALGMVVDADGLILTKASELAKDLRIVSMGKSYEAKIHGIDSKTDLAMLKIEAEDLTVANLNPVAPPMVGNWLAFPGPSEAPFSLGIVAVEARRISGSRAFVGIMPVDAEGRNGVRIDSVTADSPADNSGLRINDIILKIDETETNNRTELRAKLRKHEPGDRVTLQIVRGDKEMTIDLELAPLNAFVPMTERINQQNRMGSQLSKRRSDFPLVFQTDAGLNANQCGGPIVDLEGNIVGMSISRSERVSSLALPVETILPVIELLKTGEYSPAIVNRQQIANVDQEIAELEGSTKVDELSEQKNKLKLKVEVEQARREEIEKAIAELQLRLGELDEMEDEEAELKELTRQIFSSKRKLKKLKDLRQELINGFEN